MRIDVLLGEALQAPTDVADRVVIVIDVLRAATTVAVALTNGAAVVHPFVSVADTAAAAYAYGSAAASTRTSAVRTAGEREMVRIPGFDLGNSPLEYTRDAVEGRIILFTTTNGTAALAATREACASFFAAFVNATATAHAVAAELEANSALAGVTIVCSGTEQRVAFEDVVCAGRLVRSLLASVPQLVESDSARVARLAELPYVGNLARLREDASHARSLADAGFGADVLRCFEVDVIDRAVRFEHGALRLAAMPVIARSC